MHDIEENVGIDPEYNGGSYIIKTASGVSTYGFDVVLERIERYALNLFIEDLPMPARGSREAYDTLRNLENALYKHWKETGEQAVCNLSPQLIGLEGYRVKVVDMHGVERRFIVGRSTGWIPIHLEIVKRNSTGGVPADMEYRSVKVIERVR
jgi:hypothetical protein